jgi:hypothetical protein
VLFVLDKPAQLLGIILAIVVGLYLGTVAQVLVARATGDPMPQRFGWLKPRPTRQINIFSAVAMVIVGYGWAEQPPLNDRWRSRRFHVAGAVLARPITLALLALAAIAGLRGITHTVDYDIGDRTVKVLTGNAFAQDLLAQMALTFAGLCVVSLIPCPPTDGGRILFTLGGTSRGWQNARYQLEERNFGLAIVLGLLLLPVLFQGFPSVVNQLAPQILKGWASLVGLRA